MDKKRIYNFALIGALDVWEQAERNNKENPNELNHKRVNDAWNELQEIQRLLAEEENK